MGMSVSVYEKRFTSYSLFYELIMMPCHHMAAVAVSGLNLSSSFFFFARLTQTAVMIPSDPHHLLVMFGAHVIFQN